MLDFSYFFMYIFRSSFPGTAYSPLLFLCMPSCALLLFSFATFPLPFEVLCFLSFFVRISISNDVTVLISFDNLISSSNNYYEKHVTFRLH